MPIVLTDPDGMYLGDYQRMDQIMDRVREAPLGSYYATPEETYWTADIQLMRHRVRLDVLPEPPDIHMGSGSGAHWRPRDIRVEVESCEGCGAPDGQCLAPFRLVPSPGPRLPDVTNPGARLMPHPTNGTNVYGLSGEIIGYQPPSGPLASWPPVVTIAQTLIPGEVREIGITHLPAPTPRRTAWAHLRTSL
jgi:hypothetical protein